MQVSYEVRWFFKDAPVFLLEWFEHKGYQFDYKKPSRVDSYLPLMADQRMGIKLREGNIEAKQLIKSHGPRKFKTIKIKGEVQEFIKWSFELDKQDPLSKTILKKQKSNWIAIAKERIGYKYSFNKKGKLLGEVDAESSMDEGCQVEFTRIVIKSKIYFTFGFEAFSTSGNERKNFDLGIKLALGDLIQWNKAKHTSSSKIKLLSKSSCGYIEFLERIQLKK